MSEKKIVFLRARLPYQGGFGFTAERGSGLRANRRAGGRNFFDAIMSASFVVQNAAYRDVKTVLLASPVA